MKTDSATGLFSSSFLLVGPATHHPKVDAVDCPTAIVKNHVSVQYVLAVYNRLHSHPLQYLAIADHWGMAKETISVDLSSKV